MRWRWRSSDALREGQCSTKVLAVLVQKYNTDALWRWRFSEALREGQSLDGGLLVPTQVILLYVYLAVRHILICSVQRGA